MGKLLEIHKLQKRFGDNVVLSEVNINIECGKIYTLCGNNGSGKSTLFNIISGFLNPTTGSIIYKGKDITSLPPYRICNKGIRRTFQDLRLAKRLSVIENVMLSMQKKMFGSINQSIVRSAYEILDRVSLSDKAKEIAGKISFGQQKLLTLGCCIASDADLFLLDEPVAGIDENNQQVIIEIVKELGSKGKTVLQIEHDEKYIKWTSDLVMCLQKGNITC